MKHVMRYSLVPMNYFYQRVSIASYASAGLAKAPMSVRLFVSHTQNEES